MPVLKIDTVIFDMDGLLFDTEPLWGEAMRLITQKHQIPIRPNQFKETTGLRIHEVTEYWFRKYPWNGASCHAVADEILEDIISRSKSKGKIMEGVREVLHVLHRYPVKIGLASSSPQEMIRELLKHFELEDYFQCVTSADEVQRGKPHPAVFLRCAEQLDSHPERSLVFEDSINGMIAAKAARMKVIMVPDPLFFDDPRFSLAEKKLHNLKEFKTDYLYCL